MSAIFSKLTSEHIKVLSTLCKHASTHKEILDKHSHDETEDLRFLPSIVLKPESTDEVSKIMAYASAHNIPVTPQGARTGLSGGALPVMGGIALSLERMNNIVQLDEQNLQAIVEPGVITQELQEFVEQKGLFYPPDPSSKGSCFIGGNVAENAGGPRALKYGVTKDYVLNLEVVLADGKVIWTGANTLKNSTGYNLTQLMIGSEGTLGVVTKIVLKLIPRPKTDVLMLVPFKSAEKACQAVSAVFRAGIVPCALEFMERDAIDYTLKYYPDIASIDIDDDTKAHLLISLDGNHASVLQEESEQLYDLLQAFDCGEIAFADSQAQKDSLWAMRRKVGEAVKTHSIYKEEDTVVPRYELPKLLSGVKKIGAKYGFKSVCYGHAGDGNLHINILKGALNDEDWSKTVTKGVEEIFQLTINLGGTLSGEHGIGWVQKGYMPIAFDQRTLDLMKSIKYIFDAKGILNPSKIFPST